LSIKCKKGSITKDVVRISIKSFYGQRGAGRGKKKKDPKEGGCGKGIFRWGGRKGSASVCFSLKKVKGGVNASCSTRKFCEEGPRKGEKLPTEGGGGR